MAKRCIDAIPLRGQRLLMRVDFNARLGADGAILDDARIRASLPTIRYAVQHGARVILVSHLGRPKGKREPGLSLAPVAGRLESLLGRPVGFAADCVGPEVEARARALGDGDVLLLENCRYYKEDEANDGGFARHLAALADAYVNDAFGAAHRAHASTVGVAKFVPVAACGFLMRREIEHLGRLLANPARPFLTTLGGAMVADKLGVLEHLVTRADTLIVGGAMAFTFLRAQGLSAGDSPVEAPLVPEARRAGVPCLLPADHVIAEGTRAVAAAVAGLEGTTVIGGGGTLAAVARWGLSGRFMHCSTGGGASLEFLEGRELPGVAALHEGAS